MNESLQGIIIFISIAIVSATVWHTFLKRISLAILGAAVTTAVAFQIVSTNSLGYLDPFFIITLITSFAVAFIIALLVSVPFRVWRGKQDDGRSDIK